MHTANTNHAAFDCAVHFAKGLKNHDGGLTVNNRGGENQATSCLKPGFQIAPLHLLLQPKELIVSLSRLSWKD